MKFQRAQPPATLSGLDAARRFFAPSFDGVAAVAGERLIVAHVDKATRCLHVSEHDGDLDSVGLPIRTIVADALHYGSAGVVLAHSHPSGRAEPSKADCRATRLLAQAGEALDLTVVDHLIFATGGECCSMRRMGLL